MTKAPAATPTQTGMPPSVPVSVATASRADVPVRLSALGSVVAFNTVTVRPRVDGQLMPVDVFDRGGVTRLARGAVVTLDNQIDQATGTVRVKAVFDNRDHALFPSQFVNVQMLADTRRAQLVVPAAAIQEGPQGAFVYTVSDGKAAVRPITVDQIEGERASIAKGLDAGDVVITDGIDRLRAGSRVEVAH